jgi:hypothetical protein
MMKEEGEDPSRIGIRIVLGEDEVVVYIQWELDGEWSKIGKESYLIPDSIGMHVITTDKGGVWQERWFLTFIRIEEEVAEITLTRTVHNWYVIKGSGGPKTYYVFGAGQVARTEGPQ